MLQHELDVEREFGFRESGVRCKIRKPNSFSEQPPDLADTVADDENLACFPMLKGKMAVKAYPGTKAVILDEPVIVTQRWREWTASRSSSDSLAHLRRMIAEKFKGLQVDFLHDRVDWSWPRRSKVDIGVFGDAPAVLSQPFLWPRNRKVRIWVLSRAHRRILTEILGIPPECVGFLDLYPKKPPAPVPLEEVTHWVVASRFTEAKKIRASVHLALQFRQKFKCVRKIIFSSRMSPHWIMADPARSRWIESMRHRGVEFRFSHTKDWWEGLPKTTGLIQLSTDFTEDFGMSCFQAANQGFKLVLSAWGSHTEYAHCMATYVPYVLIDRLTGARSIPFDELFTIQGEERFCSLPHYVESDLIYQRISRLSDSTRVGLIKAVLNEHDAVFRGSSVRRQIERIMSAQKS